MSAIQNGKRLRSVRERLGFSQSEAARRASIPFQLWHSYEKGKLATLDVLHRLALAIGADPHDIDPRLASTGTGARTLTLVFSGRDPEHVALAGDTDADDALVRELLPVATVGRSTIENLIRAIGLERVKLVVRGDLAPRVVATPEPEPETPEPATPKKGGRRRPR